MRLSQESEYGLEGLLVLAAAPVGKIMLLRRIAAIGALPERFLAKIFQKLSRHNIVRSHRGLVRGYSLARHAATINLREVLEAIEGPNLLDRCLFWSSRCDPQRPCRLHPRWLTIRPGLQEMLEATTLEEIAAKPPARGGRARKESVNSRSSRAR